MAPTVLNRRHGSAPSSLARVCAIAWVIAIAPSIMAAGDVDFTGTVLAADAKTGKLTVKKDGGGTRFTFVINEETNWGPDLKGISDLKKDDHVTVSYHMQGSQYVARRIVRHKQAP